MKFVTSLISVMRHSAILSLVLWLSGNPAQAFRNDVTSFKLANGLQVVAIPDHRAPVVTHMVWYKVGAADEAPGESGLAHFLEHLLFKGTDKLKPGQFSKIVARIGGRDNAFTSQDYTAYFQRVARDKLALVMDMEADRMNNLRLTDALVLPERNVVLEERRSRVANRPGSRLSEQMNAAFYVSHPYGKPVIGWQHEIQALNRDKAMAFYKKYYAPNNAILIVAGDITSVDLRKLAKKYYGAIPAKPDLPKRVRPKEPPPEAARRVTLKDPRVTGPQIRRSYLTPSYITAQTGEAEALQVLAEILGGSSTSILFQNLVVEQKTASVVGMYYTGDGLDSGRIGIYVIPAAGKTIEEAERALDIGIADFLKTGFKKEDLKRAKNGLKADAIYAQDSQSQLARLYGRALVTGQTIEDIHEWPSRIEKVTADDVMKAARKYLRLKRSTTGYLQRTASRNKTH
jgi:zinc protease